MLTAIVCSGFANKEGDVFFALALCRCIAMDISEMGLTHKIKHHPQAIRHRYCCHAKDPISSNVKKGEWRSVSCPSPLHPKPSNVSDEILCAHAAYIGRLPYLHQMWICGSFSSALVAQASLQGALAGGQVHVVRWLMAQGLTSSVDLNNNTPLPTYVLRVEFTATPLTLAARWGASLVGLCQHSLGMAVDVSSSDKNPQHSPLYIAVLNEDVESVNSLLKVTPADSNIIRVAIGSPSKARPFVQLFIDHGISPLMIAAGIFASSDFKLIRWFAALHPAAVQPTTMGWSAYFKPLERGFDFWREVSEIEELKVVDYTEQECTSSPTPLSAMEYLPMLYGSKLKLREATVSCLRHLLNGNKNLLSALPFAQAVRKNAVGIVSLMLEFDANIVHVPDAAGVLPIHETYAGSSTHTDTLEVLLKAGADANATNSSGETLLALCARNDHETACVLLVRHGANLDVLSSEARFQLCCYASLQEQCIRAFKGQAWLNEDVLVQGVTNLPLACMHVANLTGLQTLLQCGADPFKPSRMTGLPILKEVVIAWLRNCRYDLKELSGLVDVLDTIEAAAHRLRRPSLAVFRTENGGGNLLHVAMLDEPAGSISISVATIVVRWLIQIGCDETLFAGGTTPIHLSIGVGLLDTMTPAAVKAVMNVQDDSGCTLLHLAAKRGFVSFLKLLRFGADRLVYNRLGYSPMALLLDWDSGSAPVRALQYTGKRCDCDVLWSYAAEDDVNPITGDTLLHVVAGCRENQELIPLLLERGVDPSAENAQGLMAHQLLNMSAPKARKYEELLKAAVEASLSCH